MKTFIYLIILLFCIQNVKSQTKNYNYSGKESILSEITVITVEGVEAKITPDLAAAGLIAAAGTVLPPLIDFGTKSIENKVKKNALQYKGSFSSFVSSQTFYKNSDFADLPKLKIKRDIVNSNSELLNAVEIDLIPELSNDRTAFRYYVKDKFVYNYSKAKTKRAFDYIDINIEIKMKSIFIDQGKYNISELRNTSIVVQSVLVGKVNKLDHKKYSGWIPLPQRSSAKFVKKADKSVEEKMVIKTNNENAKDTLREETTITKFNVEKHEKLSDDNGVYEIEVIITESNPFKIRMEEKVATNSGMAEALSALFKAAMEAGISVSSTDDEEKKD